MYNGTVSRLHYNYIDNAVLTCRAPRARNAYVLAQARELCLKQRQIREVHLEPRISIVSFINSSRFSLRTRWLMYIEPFRFT